MPHLQDEKNRVFLLLHYLQMGKKVEKEGQPLWVFHLHACSQPDPWAQVGGISRRYSAWKMIVEISGQIPPFFPLGSYPPTHTYTPNWSPRGRREKLKQKKKKIYKAEKKSKRNPVGWLLKKKHFSLLIYLCGSDTKGGREGVKVWATSKEWKKVRKNFQISTPTTAPEAGP